MHRGVAHGPYFLPLLHRLPFGYLRFVQGIIDCPQLVSVVNDDLVPVIIVIADCFHRACVCRENVVAVGAGKVNAVMTAPLFQGLVPYPSIHGVIQSDVGFSRQRASRTLWEEQQHIVVIVVILILGVVIIILIVGGAITLVSGFLLLFSKVIVTMVAIAAKHSSIII